MAIGTMAMLLAGGAAGGGLLKGIAGKQASDQQKNATDRAMDQEKANLESFEPWRKAGEEGLEAWREKTMAGPGEFKESEGYKFTLSEGEKAIKRASSTGAGFGTGAMGKSLARYGQGLASNEYDNFQNRYLKSLAPYQQLSGVGQRAAESQTGARTAIGNLEIDRGNIKSNNITQTSNILNDTIKDVVATLMGGGGGGMPGGGGMQIPKSLSSLGGGFNSNSIGMGGVGTRGNPLNMPVGG